MELKKLIIYNEACDISDQTWEIVKTFNHFEKATIGKQLVRSIDSISANIAEGYDRYFYKENPLFCFYSRGSLIESIDWLDKCNRRNLIETEIVTDLIRRLESLHKSLNAYIKTIGKGANDQ